MKMRYLTAGESHGPQLTAIIEGFPAGFFIDFEQINKQLARRQQGHGRGGRMKIETDTVRCVAGVRQTKTLGSPICFIIENKDYTNWEETMHPMERTGVAHPQTAPRPGHADLVGALKYHHTDDVRNVLERASARETAIHVAIGALVAQLLASVGIRVSSRVLSIGSYEGDEQSLDIQAYLDTVRAQGDSVGGSVEIMIEQMPAGVGSYVHYDRKLDGILAQAMLSINACKAISFGAGVQLGIWQGSQAHDEILYENGMYKRKTNHAGGIEGGMSNGMPIVMTATLKPIPTLMKPLQTIDLAKHNEVTQTFRERSDVSVVHAFSVVAEHVVAWNIAQVLCEQLRSDTIEQFQADVQQLRKQMRGMVTDAKVNSECTE